MKPLPRTFYARDTAEVARALLGKRLVRRSRDGLTSAMIVETEAYLERTDPACHTFRGKTARNAAMFGPPGSLYVYTIHARWCMNVVTAAEGIGDAVLIRAAEPLDGLHLMRDRRQRTRERELTRGPARLCEAMDVNGNLNGYDLTIGRRVWLCEAADNAVARGEIGISPRIGISVNQQAPLRFFLRANHYVSGPKRLNCAESSLPDPAGFAAK